jgi:hypothetical protein
MDCKTCENSLRSDFSYCPSCGGKIIRNRLTIKNIWQDIVYQVFDFDNTLFKTFRHLFTKPEVVIDSFISGARKKYMNPISYIAIAITLTGILVFFIRRAFPEGIDFDIMNTGVYNAETNKALTDFMLTFYNILFILQVPILSLAGLLAFNEKKYLFSEHLVSFMYTQAQYSLISIPISSLIVVFIPQLYMYSSISMLVIMLSYNIYVLKRLHAVKKGEFLLKGFVFIVLFGVGYMFLSVLQFVWMFATGVISFNIN